MIAVRSAFHSRGCRVLQQGEWQEKELLENAVPSLVSLTFTSHSLCGETPQPLNRQPPTANRQPPTANSLPLSVHLVFLNQYYPPDAAPTGVMLEAVVDRLVKQGHEVTVICAEGGYAGGGVNIEPSTPSGYAGSRHRTSNIEHRSEEVCSGVSATIAGCSSSSESQNPKSKIKNPESSIPASPIVIRLRASRFGRGSFVGKLADYASYYLGAAWKLGVIQPRPDRVIALTTPPYLSVLARLVSKLRGADHAHWVMDLYPDVMLAHGMLEEGGWKHRLLAGLARWGFGGCRCAAILTLGPDMAERLLNIERRTSNIERRSEEGDVKAENRSELEDSGASGTAADVFSPIQNPKSKIQNHPSPIHWVPLWGSEARRAVGSGRLADSRERDVDRLEDCGVQLAENDPPDVPIQNPKSKIQNPKSALRAKRGWRDDELIVMYSGNMGLGHRFAEFLEAAKRVNIEPSTPSGYAGSRHRTSNTENRSEEGGRGDSAIGSISVQNPKSKIQNHPSSRFRFVFYGAGKRRVEIESFMREHPDCAVELHDYAPAEELAEHLLSADVHLASLDAAWTGTMVPSKLQGIFAVGRPVIFVGSPASSIGRWVTESGGGWVVVPDDVDHLLAALEEAGDPAVREARGLAAKVFSDLHFDRETNATRVADIFIR